MARNSDYKILFKCCFKLDAKNNGYMFEGEYIENISAYLWKKIDQWKREGIKSAKYDMIRLLCDIKRKQSSNWAMFMKQPENALHPFKSTYNIILSEIKPSEPFYEWRVLDHVLYETYYKK